VGRDVDVLLLDDDEVDDDEVDVVVGRLVDVLVDVDVLREVDVELDVDVVVVVGKGGSVVVGAVLAKPAIWKILLLPSTPGSHVDTNRSFGRSGSNSRPIGGAAANPVAKRSSTGVFVPPTGRPVASSMRIDQSSLSTKLTYSRSPPNVPPGTYWMAVTPWPPTRGGPERNARAKRWMPGDGFTAHVPAGVLASNGTS
jgi:hypothetical protein